MDTDIRDDVEKNPLNFFLKKSLSEELVYVVLSSIVNFTNSQEKKTKNREGLIMKQIDRLEEKQTLETREFLSGTFKQKQSDAEAEKDDNEIIEETNISPHFDVP